MEAMIKLKDFTGSSEREQFVLKRLRSCKVA